jgi:signal transduction histidine kinase
MRYKIYAKRTQMPICILSTQATSTKTRYQDEFEMKMYFMITELLNNIETQWSKNKAKLTLIENDNQLTVTVADNGNGFKTNDETAIEGFGLHQIRRIRSSQRASYC